ncbi:lipase secretion chaperone [Pseudoalteromonas porphyrae]|uniref:lipase secretion chaperone n=1 Tax=Pseudoalteromonas porphyrae TaxID=187330 RepID=UPI0009E8D397|nr:lipase secretion chaperone [Pseudoalteromonas porphyrae]
MSRSYRIGLVVITTVLVVSYFIYPADKRASLPAVTIPTAVDDIFEHVILAEQEREHFNIEQTQHACTQIVQCKKHAALFTRYLSFKQELAQLQYTLIALPLSEQLKTMIAFQSRFFSDDEIALLFDDDNQWQRYTIAKLEINEDETISDELKQQLLVNLESALPERLTQALKPSKQLQALNNEFEKALINSDYNQLASEFGDASATRLIALQQQREQWQALSKQLISQINLLNEQYDKEQAKQKITALLDEHLTPNQKRRFLAIYPRT